MLRLLLNLAALGAALAEECDVASAAVELLQLGQAVQQSCGHLTQDHCDPSANYICSNNCKVHTNGHDCYRPVPDVMAEHPGMDGYCYFNYTGFWVNPLAGGFEDSAVNGILGLRDGSYKGLNTGPLLKYDFEGETVYTYMDAPHYSFDDLYGYSLGFLQGQGLDPHWMQNKTHWVELSEQACTRIQEKYNFQKEELVLADWLDDNQVLAAQTLCSAGVDCTAMRADVKAKAEYHSPENCKGITHREFAKHHYIKCLLGYTNSGSDMAYLNARSCLLEGNRIGHFSECPYSPPVSF
ncbi:unnamed protein product [Effrenium voratum]|uniref:Uncharacterized protein n=1 Tax=Effrenium voratum TaxID=2562239 RepID=A0AA36JJZ8_9DINO|nr:unnamed protein product [Effrenium voratum]